MLSRKKLLDCAQNNFGDKMITLSSPGLADMVIFRKYASTVIRIQEDETEIAKMQEKKVADVAKTIAEEIKSIEHDKTTYKKGINIGIAMEEVRPTLSQLLSYISPRLKECSLPSIMIGNIVTSQSQRRNIQLLLALSLLVREKKVIERLYDYGVVSSYDETKLFRSSAAVEGNKLSTESILKSESHGLVQAVADNFDCNIASPNGLRQTHSLAMIMTQKVSDDSKDRKHDRFPRLKKSIVKDKDLKDVPLIHYQCLR